MIYIYVQSWLHTALTYNQVDGSKSSLWTECDEKIYSKTMDKFIKNQDSSVHCYIISISLHGKMFLYHMLTEKNIWKFEKKNKIYDDISCSMICSETKNYTSLLHSKTIYIHFQGFSFLENQEHLNLTNLIFFMKKFYISQK